MSQQCIRVHSPSLFCFGASCLTQDSGQHDPMPSPQVLVSPEKPRACAHQLWCLMSGSQERCGKGRTCATLWRYFPLLCFQSSSSLLADSRGGQVKLLLRETLPLKCLTPTGRGRGDTGRSSSSGKGINRGNHRRTGELEIKTSD